MSEIEFLSVVEKVVLWALPIDWVSHLLTLIAALGGSYFAFKLASYAERRKLLLNELQATSRAFVSVYSGLNSAFNFKKQIALPKRLELDRITAQIEQIHIAPNDIIRGEQFIVEFKDSLKSITPMSLLPGNASEQMSQVTQLTGRPTIFAHLFDKSLAQLASVIELHNVAIAELKKDKGTDNEAIVNRVLGLVDGDGHYDETYRHRVEHMQECTDDIIYFGSEIIKDLVLHSKQLKSRIGDKNLRIMSLTLSDEWEALKPDSSKYNTWDDLPTIEQRNVR